MRVVAVYSIKGGVGKTTAAVNLAWEAAKEFRVLLWDLDPQGASTFLLNVKPKVKGGVGATRRRAKQGVRAPSGPPSTRTSTCCQPMRAIAISTSSSTTRRSPSTGGEDPRARRARLRRRHPRLPARGILVAENAVVLGARHCGAAGPVSTVDAVARSGRGVRGGIRSKARVVGFLSMVDRRKTLHRDAVQQLHRRHEKSVTDVVVPATVQIERMGTTRAPIGTYAPSDGGVTGLRRTLGRVQATVKQERASTSNEGSPSSRPRCVRQLSLLITEGVCSTVRRSACVDRPVRDWDPDVAPGSPLRSRTTDPPQDRPAPGRSRATWTTDESARPRTRPAHERGAGRRE